MVTASERAPRVRVDGGGELERENGRGLGKSDHSITKMKNLGHLRTWWSIVELREASVTSIGALEGELRAAVVTSSGDW